MNRTTWNLAQYYAALLITSSNRVGAIYAHALCLCFFKVKMLSSVKNVVSATCA